jgi:hypothetical protein
VNSTVPKARNPATMMMTTAPTAATVAAMPRPPAAPQPEQWRGKQQAEGSEIGDPVEGGGTVAAQWTQVEDRPSFPSAGG